jgi:hypothetical protein
LLERSLSCGKLPGAAVEVISVAFSREGGSRPQLRCDPQELKLSMTEKLLRRAQPEPCTRPSLVSSSSCHRVSFCREGVSATAQVHYAVRIKP